MGYKSTVYIAVPKKDEKELNLILSKHDLKSYADENKRYIPLEIGVHGEIDMVDYAIYELEYLKWYDEFPSVAEVNAFIRDDEWESCDNGGRVLFCVGEDNAIHTEIGGYHDMFYVSVKVEPYF